MGDCKVEATQKAHYPEIKPKRLDASLRWHDSCFGVITKRLMVRVFQCYRALISPLFGNCCRFYPSCSVYAQEAIERYGCLRGMWLALKRLLKCHPGSAGGVDLVP